MSVQIYRGTEANRSKTKLLLFAPIQKMDFLLHHVYLILPKPNKENVNTRQHVYFVLSCIKSTAKRDLNKVEAFLERKGSRCMPQISWGFPTFFMFLYLRQNRTSNSWTCYTGHFLFWTWKYLIYLKVMFDIFKVVLKKKTP